MERKALRRAFLCDKDRLFENEDKLPFGCLVGGDLCGDRPTPYDFWLERSIPAVSCLKTSR